MPRVNKTVAQRVGTEWTFSSDDDGVFTHEQLVAAALVLLARRLEDTVAAVRRVSETLDIIDRRQYRRATRQKK